MFFSGVFAEPLTRLRAGAAPSLKLWSVSDLRWAQARLAPAGESAGREPPSPEGEGKGFALV